MRRSDMVRLVLALALGVALTWGGAGIGCNPNLVQSLGGEPSLPTAPGQAKYVLMRLTNACSATMPVPAGSPPGSGAPVGVNYLVTWRYAGGQRDVFGTSGGGLAPTEDIGTLIPCNLTVITMGDVDDLTADGAWLAYSATIQQPLKPFGKLLQNGVDFRCGDVLTFVTFNDPNDSRSYAVDYQVQSGQDVTGPFTGPDTFMNFENQSTQWEAGLPYP